MARPAIDDFLETQEAEVAALAGLIGLVLIILAVALLLGVTIDKRSQRRADSSIYEVVHGYARLVKAILQMVIGVVAVAIVGWKFVHERPPLRPPASAIGEPAGETATSLLLDGIGVGLAAAAVVELAYTLFTDGPDEALDPLMLGLSAAILIQLGGMNPGVPLEQATVVLALGVLLAVLFATRLILAERHDGEDPKGIWWIGWLRTILRIPSQPAQSEPSEGRSGATPADRQ